MNNQIIASYRKTNHTTSDFSQAFRLLILLLSSEIPEDMVKNKPRVFMRTSLAGVGLLDLFNKSKSSLQSYSIDPYLCQT
jgi:hypothetical protein